MRNVIWTFNLLIAFALPPQSPTHDHPAAASPGGLTPGHAVSAGYGDVQSQLMVPELGADSPQVSILRVDPKRTPPSC